MDNSWVKLYRKVRDHDVIKDPICSQILLWLFTGVDKKTGNLTIGRYWASNQLGLNSNTFYKALKRLEKKYKIVTLSSNNKFTTVSLSNWAKYNSYNKVVTQVGNNKVTTKEQQSNTIQDYKNREYKTKDKSLQKVEYGNQEINILISYMKEKLGLVVLDDSIESNRRYAKLCINKFGVEKVRIAIDATTQSKFWHSKITSFKGLYYNSVKIVSSLRGEVKSIDATKVLDSKNERWEGVSSDGEGIRSIQAGES